MTRERGLFIVVVAALGTFSATLGLIAAGLLVALGESGAVVNALIVASELLILGTVAWWAIVWLIFLIGSALDSPTRRQRQRQRREHQDAARDSS